MFLIEEREEALKILDDIAWQNGRNETADKIRSVIDFFWWWRENYIDLNDYSCDECDDKDSDIDSKEDEINDLENRIIHLKNMIYNADSLEQLQAQVEEL
ncbi:MAG: hypothetical protein FWE16_05685 [Firmicutes bacterium]|nr:hypothetical protein [Bacillota bacterium]